MHNRVSRSPYLSPAKARVRFWWILLSTAFALAVVPVHVARAPIKGINTHTIQASAGGAGGCQGGVVVENGSNTPGSSIVVKLWVRGPVKEVSSKGVFRSISGLTTTVVTLKGGALGAGEKTRIVFQGQESSAQSCEVYRREVVRAEQGNGDGDRRRRDQDFDADAPERTQEGDDGSGGNGSYIETE